jgi:hypothetical protein
MAAPSTAAAQSSARSRLDWVRVLRASETLAHRAKPPARELSDAPPGSPCVMSGSRPSIPAMP